MSISTSALVIAAFLSSAPVPGEKVGDAGLLAATTKAMRTPKEESEEVMNFLLQAAAVLLSKHGEFFPLGATMGLDEKVAAAAVDEGEERPPSQRIIDSLLDVFRSLARKKQIKAAGIAYDVRTLPPGSTEKVDAVAVRLDHQAGNSIVVMFPYRILPSREVRFGDPFAAKGPADVFH